MISPVYHLKLWLLWLTYALALGQEAFPSVTAAEPSNSCRDCDAGEKGSSSILSSKSAALGNFSLLLQPIIFADESGSPINASSAGELLRQTTAVLRDFSAGKFLLSTTTAPPVRLEQPKSYYATRSRYTLLKDASNAAVRAGIQWSSSSYECLYTSPIYPTTGYAVSRGRTVWLSTDKASVLVHEIGHLFGFFHAGGWNATNDSIIGPGKHVDYANPHDQMGQVHGFLHFNTYLKSTVGWLEPGIVQEVIGSGEYWLEAHDTNSLLAGKTYALRIPGSRERFYWVEARNRTGDEKNPNGVFLIWEPWAESFWCTQLLDTTPGTPGGFQDAALRVGRSFTDTESGFRLSVLEQAGSAYRVRVDRFSPGTNPNPEPLPAFHIRVDPPQPRAGEKALFSVSSQAAPPPGSIYFWQFSHGGASQNSSQVEVIVPDEGPVIVRCEVRTPAGAARSANLVLHPHNALAAWVVVTGKVISAAGPVDFARVSVPGLAAGLTDSTGTYYLRLEEDAPPVLRLEGAFGAQTLLPLSFSLTTWNRHLVTADWILPQPNKLLTAPISWAGKTYLPIQLHSPGVHQVEISSDLATWAPLLQVTGPVQTNAVVPSGLRQVFFRISPN